MNSSISNSEAEATRLERQSLRRFLVRYLLPFIAILAVFCLGWDYLLREKLIFKTEIQGVTKLHRIYERHPGEIPIIGSSRAQGAYIPDSIHPMAYNYGINGIGYPVMDIFMGKALAFPEEKGPLILNFDYEMFIKSIGDVNNYIALSHEPEVRALLKKAEMYSIVQEINGLRFFDAFDLYMREYLNQRLQLTKWITKGASIEKDPVTQEEIEKLVRQRLKDPAEWDPKPEMVEAMFKRIAQRPDRKWYIIIAPYHDSYYTSFNPAHFQAARSLLKRLDDLPNAQVLEFSGRGWPDSLFVNTTHINLPGSIRFSREVRQALQGDSTRFVP